MPAPFELRYETEEVTQVTLKAFRLHEIDFDMAMVVLYDCGWDMLDSLVMLKRASPDSEWSPTIPTIN